MKLGKQKAALILAALLIISVVYSLFDKAVSAVVMPMAKTLAESSATAIIEESALSAIPENAEFTKTDTDSDGVKSIFADVSALQNLRAAVTKRITDDTQNLLITVSMPLGSIIGGGFFSGRGIPIKVRITAAGGLLVDTESEFASAGLNQTLHRVYVTISLRLTLLYHGRTEEITVSTKITASEKVIVGEVPDAYFRSYG